MTIPEIILEQLGGRKFIVCTGCKNFLADGDNKLIMTIPRNASKANRLEVTYNYGMDDYTMRFYRHTSGRFMQKRLLEGKDPWIPAKDKDIKVFNGVYCDQLRELFTEVTGMVIPMSITINGVKFG